MHESVYEQFIQAFKQRVQQISVIGDPFEETTFQGPQVTKAQYDRILSYISLGKSEGATLVSGGEPASLLKNNANKDSNGNGKGFFITPTIFTNVTPNMRIHNEEIFGPVVVISPFGSESEALSRANNSLYGLGAAVFTKDLARAHRVAQRLEAGMVWVNSSNDGDWRVPFGGVKQSGVGRELGEEGLRAYTVEKAVHINLGTML